MVILTIIGLWTVLYGIMRVVHAGMDHFGAFNDDARKTYQGNVAPPEQRS